MKAMMSVLAPHDSLNTLYLLVFCAIFAGVVAWALRSASDKDMEEAARLPFND